MLVVHGLHHRPSLTLLLLQFNQRLTRFKLSHLILLRLVLTIVRILVVMVSLATEVSLVVVVAAAAALVGVVVSGPTTIRAPLLTTVPVSLAALLDSGARFVTRLVIM